MKNLVYFSLAFITLSIVSCGKIELPESNKSEKTDSTTTTIIDTTQTETSDTLTVSEVLSLGSGYPVVVPGYIVGYINGTTLSKAVFGVPTSDDITNFLIADHPGETSVSNCMPVSLNKSSAFHTELSIYLHPENYKRKVCLFGNTVTYFKTTGFKNIIEYNWLGSKTSTGQTIGIDTTTVIVKDGRTKARN